MISSSTMQGLYELNDGGWIGDCILAQDGTEYTYGPYEGDTVFATRDEAKQAAFALAKAEIDN
jgi:hypothetical protein